MPFLATIEGQFAFGRQPTATQTTQTTGIVTTDLLLYLDAGNPNSYPGSGTTWTDLSSNTNNATSLTGTTYSPIFGGYLTFDGTTGSGSLVSSKYNTAYTGKTVFVSGNLTGITNGTYRAMLGSSSGSRNFNFYMYSPSANTYALHFSAGGTGTISANMSYVPGDWFTVAVTQAADGTTKYFLNGVKFNTTTQTLTAYGSSTEHIGRADNYFYGPLTVACVYKSELTEAQILQNHSAVYSRYCAAPANLVSYYDPANPASYGGSGTSITDLSSTPLTGTLSNVSFTNPYFSYNGSNSQISIPDNAKLEPGSGSWTMEAWFYTTAFKTGGSGVILGKFNNGGGSQDVSYSIRTNNTGVVYAQIGNGAGAYVNSTSYQSVLSTWVQVVYVWTNSGATKTLETFINGASIGSVNHSLASILNSSNALYNGLMGVLESHGCTILR
jgi:hypothetical protein